MTDTPAPSLGELVERMPCPPSCRDSVGSARRLHLPPCLKPSLLLAIARLETENAALRERVEGDTKLAATLLLELGHVGADPRLTGLRRIADLGAVVARASERPYPNPPALTYEQAAAVVAAYRAAPKGGDRE